MSATDRLPQGRKHRSELLREFYAGRRVVVTGHTGFKGTWIALWLAELGAEVFGYSLAPDSTPSLFSLVGGDRWFKGHELGDIRQRETLTAFIAQARPEVVFHLAAQPLVRRSYTEPVLTYETNVMGTLNLLEAVRKTATAKVVQVITTDKCYENFEVVRAYREDDPLGGFDPYSSSKACAEIMVSAYRRSYFKDLGMSLASTRAGNVIGGGDWAADRIVPDCARAMTSRQRIEIRNPSAVRPWQHVLEPLSGYLELARRQFQAPAEFAGAWNFGPAPGKDVPVGDLVGGLCARWEIPLDALANVTEPAPQQQSHGLMHEAQTLRLDITKAAVGLGWTPTLSTADMIGMTADWYRSWCADGSTAAVRDLTLGQIRDFMGRMGPV